MKRANTVKYDRKTSQGLPKQPGKGLRSTSLARVRYNIAIFSPFPYRFVVGVSLRPQLARRPDSDCSDSDRHAAPTTLGSPPQRQSARRFDSGSPARWSRPRRPSLAAPCVRSPPIPERSSGGTAATGRRRVAGDGMMSHSWKINDSQRFKGTKHYPRPCHGFRYALHRAPSPRARACQNVALANAGRRGLVALTGFGGKLPRSTGESRPFWHRRSPSLRISPARRRNTIPIRQSGHKVTAAFRRNSPRADPFRARWAVGVGAQDVAQVAVLPVRVRMAGIHRNRKIEAHLSRGFSRKP